jgi:hypothetical protein
MNAPLIIQTVDGPMTVPNPKFPVPGLAIHHAYLGHGVFSIGGGYIVSHVHSGFKLAGFTFQRQAIIFAHLFAEHYPVNVTVKELKDAYAKARLNGKPSVDSLAAQAEKDQPKTRKQIRSA